MGYIPLLVKLDLIQPIDKSRVPNLEKVMPIFRNDPNINVDGKLYGVPFTWGGGPMVYDPAVITTPPTSWKDLLKPEYTGKVGMMDDPLGNMMIGALVATGTQTPTKLTAAQLEQTIDFLIEVKKQSRVVAASWGDLADCDRARRRGDHLQRLGNAGEVLRRQGQGGTICLPVRAHQRLARQLLHRQGRAESRRGL